MFFRLTGSDREKQMEENLQGIGKGLGNLKNMANNMNVEINRQNNQLDVINEKVGLILSDSTNQSQFLDCKC